MDYPPTHQSQFCYSGRHDLYGYAIIRAVQEKMPDIKFIITDSHTETPHFMMQELYDQCFVGLHPTSHDGQSTTVAELGLMGRRVIHNGLAPNCIPWREGGKYPLQYVDDIVESIKREQEAKHAVLRVSQIELALQVRKFLDIGEYWLDTDFYGGVKNENSSLCKIQS